MKGRWFFLGLGRDYLRKIDVGDNFQIDLNKLKSAILKDIDSGYTPLVLIGNAGTTNTGSFDNLKSLAKIAKEFNLWYHVDGAYGLPARSITEHTDKFNGVEEADSITVNPHKMDVCTV